MTLRTRRLPILALTLLFVLLTVREAIAHAHLKRSSPSAKEQLSAPPRSIQLWFSETPQVPFTTVKLIGAGGAEVAVGPIVAGSEMSVSVDVRGELAPGDYAVVWQTGAADGHPSRGRFSFTVLASADNPARDSAPMAATDSTQANAASSPQTRGNAIVGSPTDSSAASPREQGAARWLEFVALLAVIGVIMFRFAVVPALVRQSAPTADLIDAALRFGRASLVLLFVAMWVRLYMEMRTMFGERATAPGMLRETILSTTWGHGWLTGVVGVVVAGIGFALARRVAAGWLLAAIGVLMAAITPALTGHAIASPVAPAWAVIFDALHVICAGAWIGTLATIVFAALPVLRARLNTAGSGSFGSALLPIVRAFNPIALGAVGLLVFSGVVSARYRVGTLSALVGTTYGKLLLVKLGLVLLVALAGAWNWRRLTPALSDDRSAFNLRRSAMIELTVAAFVLAVTAALVVTSPPADAAAAMVGAPSIR